MAISWETYGRIVENGINQEMNGRRKKRRNCNLLLFKHGNSIASRKERICLKFTIDRGKFKLNKFMQIGFNYHLMKVDSRWTSQLFCSLIIHTSGGVADASNCCNDWNLVSECLLLTYHFKKTSFEKFKKGMTNSIQNWSNCVKIMDDCSIYMLSSLF